MQFPYQKPLPHYYGDMTRIIFVAIGIIMLLGLPQMTVLLNIPAGVSIFSIVTVAVAAGFTNPKIYLSLVFNVVVSLLGLALFIYFTIFMRAHALRGFFLVLNQVVAILFLFSLYLSVKSLRGFSGK